MIEVYLEGLAAISSGAGSSSRRDAARAVALLELVLDFDFDLRTFLTLVDISQLDHEEARADADGNCGALKFL